MARGKGRERKRRGMLRRANSKPIFKDYMGLFKEYLAMGATLGPQLDSLRRTQLARIGRALGSDVITYAARIAQLPPQVDISVTFDDVLPFTDVLNGLSGKRVTVVLETPGGFGEVGKNLVEILHDRFEHVTFLVPGTAKSTGTIMCLGGNEIIMGPASSLGPIDAQLSQDGKRFSADAFLEGFKSIKNEVDATKQLNAAYIPMLQRISPGELQNAHNALEFARATVTDWLCRYKFADWKKNGVEVSDDEKRARARQIADELARQSKWFSHGHSIRIPDLTSLGLKIVDFSKDPELNDAVLRYQVLLRMTFESGPVYKLYESPAESIARRFEVPAVSPDLVGNLLGQMQAAPSVQVKLDCPNCKQANVFQLDFVPAQPLQPGSRRYPESGSSSCMKCGQLLNLAPPRAELENKLGRKALSPQPQN